VLVLAADGFHQGFGFGRVRCRSGHDLNDSGVGLGVRCREWHASHSGQVTDVVGDLVDDAYGVGAGDDVGRHDERAVVARAEVLTDHLIGVASRAAFLLGTVVRQRKPQARGWNRAYRETGDHRHTLIIPAPQHSTP
jgi:hypothetical protein